MAYDPNGPRPEGIPQASWDAMVRAYNTRRGPANGGWDRVAPRQPAGSPITTTQARAMGLVSRLMPQINQFKAQARTSAATQQNDDAAALGFLANLFADQGGRWEGGGPTVSYNYDPRAQLEQMWATAQSNINGAYDQALGAIGNQRTAGLGEIGAAYGDFQNRSGTIAADSQARFAQQNDAIKGQLAGYLADVNTRNAGITNDLAAQGVNIPTLNAEVQSAADAGVNNITAQNASQQNLAARMGQVQDYYNAAAQQGGALVNQGARGTLENNYNDIVAQIQFKRAQELAAAQQQYMGQMADVGMQVADRQFEAAKFNAGQQGQYVPGMTNLEKLSALQGLEAAGLENQALKKDLAGGQVVGQFNISALTPEALDFVSAGGGDFYTTMAGLADARDNGDMTPEEYGQYVAMMLRAVQQ